jgi:hypothetical protein
LYLQTRKARVDEVIRITNNSFGKYVNRMVFLDKDRTMDNVQKHNILTLVFVCGFRDYIFNETDLRALEIKLCNTYIIELVCG